MQNEIEFLTENKKCELFDLPLDVLLIWKQVEKMRIHANENASIEKFESKTCYTRHQSDKD